MTPANGPQPPVAKGRRKGGKDLKVAVNAASADRDIISANNTVNAFVGGKQRAWMQKARTLPQSAPRLHLKPTTQPEKQAQQTHSNSNPQTPTPATPRLVDDVGGMMAMPAGTDAHSTLGTAGVLPSPTPSEGRPSPNAPEPFPHQTPTDRTNIEQRQPGNSQNTEQLRQELAKRAAEDPQQAFIQSAKPYARASTDNYPETSAKRRRLDSGSSGAETHSSNALPLTPVTSPGLVNRLVQGQAQNSIPSNSTSSSAQIPVSASTQQQRQSISHLQVQQSLQQQQRQQLGEQNAVACQRVQQAQAPCQDGQQQPQLPSQAAYLQQDAIANRTIQHLGNTNGAQAVQSPVRAVPPKPFVESITGRQQVNNNAMSMPNQQVAQVPSNGPPSHGPFPPAPTHIVPSQGPNIPLKKPASIPAFLKSIGGTHNLNQPERVRLEWLTHAVRISDWGFVVLHQLFCLTTAPPEVLDSLLPRNCLHGFSFLATLLTDNTGLTPRFLEFFCDFPEHFTAYVGHPWHQRIVMDLVPFLTHGHQCFNMLMQACVKRRTPPTADEMLSPPFVASVLVQRLMWRKIRLALDGGVDTASGNELEKQFVHQQVELIHQRGLITQTVIHRGRQNSVASTLAQARMALQGHIVQHTQSAQHQDQSLSLGQQQQQQQQQLSQQPPQQQNPVNSQAIQNGTTNNPPTSGRLPNQQGGVHRLQHIDPQHLQSLQQAQRLQEQPRRMSQVIQPPQGSPINAQGLRQAQGASPRNHELRIHVPPMHQPVPPGPLSQSSLASTVHTPRLPGNFSQICVGQSTQVAVPHASAASLPAPGPGPVASSSAMIDRRPSLPTRTSSTPQLKPKEPLEHFIAVVDFAVRDCALPDPMPCVTRSFDVPESQAKRLSQWVKHETLVGRTKRTICDGSLIFRLRCVRSVKEKGDLTKDNIWVLRETTWPKNIFMQLNQKPLQPKRKNIYGSDLVLDVTFAIKQGMNELKIAMLQDRTNSLPLGSYHLRVEILEARSYGTITKNMGQLQTIDAQQAKGIITSRLRPNQTDDDVVVQSQELNISITCPIGMTLLKLPVRGKNCPHLECFDFDNFLESRPRRKAKEPPIPDSWKCPLCSGDARPQELIIDGFILEIIQIIKQRGLAEHTREIVVKDDGTWDVKKTQSGGLTGTVNSAFKSKQEKKTEIEVIELDD
ncbi:hypothetical protein DFH27DRAFT_601844 [Peziza echinospora]|nr:hypothetical protein DFH27DRAFT_601844 [Peziza echinospora]